MRDQPCAASAPACSDRPRCPVHDTASATLPRDGVDRVVIAVLRFLAAARETGDAACWDVALDRAEAAFGPRDGALLVARAATLLRCLARDGSVVGFLPPPCRRLSSGEVEVLAGLHGRSGDHRADTRRSAAVAAALADIVAMLRDVCRPVVSAPMPSPSPSQAAPALML